MHNAVLVAASPENYPEMKTGGVSPLTQSVFTLGTALGATCGLLLNNRPVRYANSVTLVFALALF